MIDVYSDFICPWCYIGWRKIQATLAEVPEKQRALVEWRAYQLDPDASVVPGVTAVEAMMGWYASADEARLRIAKIMDAGSSVGLALRLDRARPVNTMDAHRLARLADLEGVGAEIREALFRAYHLDGGNIAGRDQLVHLAEQIGIAPMKAQQWLEDDGTRDSVRMDQARALQARVRSVPSLVVANAEPFSPVRMASRLPSLLQSLAS